MGAFSSQYRVLYYETDKMSIVHHSNYVRYMETARTEMIRDWGYSYDDIEKAGIWMPVLGVEVDFKTPAVYDEVLNLKCWTTKLKGASVEIAYEISNYETGEVHVTGKSRHGFTTPELKPIKLKKEAPEIYELFKNAMED
ncbi:MAG: acyl-CoA thioesterase [Eubacterium sp.]|nr:acyl-CoA thioesterase [Candidatus Colimonas fimequi]